MKATVSCVRQVGSWASVALVLAMSAGCAITSTPKYDDNFGNSIRTVTAQQIANLDAPTKNRSSGTTDGRSVAGFQKVYAERNGYLQKEPSPPPPVREIVRDNSK